MHIGIKRKNFRMQYHEYLHRSRYVIFTLYMYCDVEHITYLPVTIFCSNVAYNRSNKMYLKYAVW